MWPSHLILMFAHIAIIDLSLFSGVEYTKHGKRPREACVCLINKALRHSPSTSSALSQCLSMDVLK